MSIEATVSGIKKIVVGAIICHYGVLQLKDSTHGELKARVNGLLNSVKGIQSYYKSNPLAKPEQQAAFNREFSKDEVLLIAEIFELLHGIDEHGLEEIHTAIKNAIIYEQAHTSSNI